MRKSNLERAQCWNDWNPWNIAARIILSAALALYPLSAAIASTGCNYPTSLDSWTDKIAGDQLTVADVNQFRCAIEQVQAAVGATGSVKFATLAGLGANQTLYGATTASGSLTLSSTSHATKGVIIFGTAGGFDEINVRLGIGTLLPAYEIDVAKTGNTTISQVAAGSGVQPSFVGGRARNTLASPQAVQDTDILVALQGNGYDGSNYVTSTALRGVALETFSGSQRGSALEFYTTARGAPSMGRTALLSAGYGLGLEAGSSFMHFYEEAANTGNPNSGSEAVIYMKADKLIITYNDGGTQRWKYLDLTGTGATWTHTTTPP